MGSPHEKPSESPPPVGAMRCSQPRPARKQSLRPHVEHAVASNEEAAGREDELSTISKRAG